MAKKTKPKKTKPKPPVALIEEPIKQNQRREVSIEKVSNGYIVSSYDENYDRQSKIAKTKAEAKKFGQQMMKI